MDSTDTSATTEAVPSDIQSSVTVVIPIQNKDESTIEQNLSMNDPGTPVSTNAVSPDIYSSVTVVIPAYNEEISLGTVVLMARQRVKHVIVVDDGSTDKTGLVAALAGATVIRLDENTGKAYALLLGLRKAREQGCAAAVMMDADAQHFTSDIPRLAAGVITGQADLVIGSRFIETDRTIPLYRKAGQKTLNIFTNIGAGKKVSDSQSGFRALSRKALDNLDFRSNGYNIESDMISYFAAQGLVIEEIPINVRYDVPNKHKKNPVTHGMGVLTQLVNIIGYRRPLLAFGIPGITFILGGMLGEVWVFEELRNAGIFHDVLAIGCAFILTLGLLLMISGLILNTLLLIIKENKQ
jgi:glycosyltransferase involved in cell wall biosynthesis